MQNVVADAPRFLKATPQEGGMEITFSNVPCGLKVRGAKTTATKVAGFSVANAERKWVWAEAEIVGPDTVLVKYPKEMPEVVAVWYG